MTQVVRFFAFPLELDDDDDDDHFISFHFDVERTATEIASDDFGIGFPFK